MPIQPISRPPVTASANLLSDQDGERRLRGGIFGDLFNLLGRPSSAINTGIRNSLDDDSLTTFLGGLGEGITGKTQTSFSDVLADQGVDGKLGAIGGFAGDVLLDPLTYVGVKKMPGTTKTSALIEAMKLGGDNVDNVAAELLAKNPTRIGLTVAGKPILSTKLPSTGVAEALLGPSTDRRLIAKAFSRNAELPEGLNEMNRVIDSASNAKFNDFRVGIKETFMKDLDPSERQAISFAIEEGKTLDNTPVLNGNARFKTLGEYQKLAQRVFDDAFVQEAQLGLFKPKKGTKGALATDYEKYNSKYVYRYFRNPPKDLIPGETVEIRAKVGGPDSADFMKQRKKDVSLSAAKELGYDPITDIAEILDLRMAKHFRTTQRAVFVRDAVDKFGISAEDLAKLPKDSQVRSLNWHPAESVRSPVTEGNKQVFVPEFVARALNQTEATFRSGTVGNQMMRGFDKAIQQWKFWNTAAMPGYHIRNSFSDFLMNAADGVTNPTRYGQAAKVMRDVDDINTQTLLQVGDPTATVVPKGQYKVKVGNRQLTTDEVWRYYGESGSKSGLITAELTRALDPLEKGKIVGQGSKLKSAIGDFSDKREDYFRVAHFIDAFDKAAKKTKNLDEAAQIAGKTVRKYNIDYGNLSSFERNVVGKVIPFYTFMRRATPLNMELLFTKPGFMALYPKGQDLAQGILGTDDGTGEQLVPQWIKDMAPVRLALDKQNANSPRNQILSWLGVGENEPGFLSTTTGMTPFDTLDLPLEPLSLLAQGDVGGALRSPVADLWAGVNPAISIPTEIQSGRNQFTGQEITDWPGWLASKIGPGRAINKGMGQGVGNSIAGNVLGLPVQVATGARQEGEYMRRQDIVDQQNRNKKLKTLRERFDGFDDLPEARREQLLRGVRSPQDPESKAQRRYLTQILGQ